MSEAGQAGAWSGGRREGEDASSPMAKAADAVQAVKQEAASFAAGAKDRAADKIEAGKGAAGEALGDFAHAIRAAGETLSSSDQSVAGRMVGRAAEGLEGLARSVSDKRPEELLDAVRDFGRRNPAALIAGSVLLGVALGRFLRSSGADATDDGPAAARLSAPNTPAPGFDDRLLSGPGEGAASGASRFDAEI